MCFKCDDCGRVSEPREKMRRVPVEYRKQTYENRKGRNVKLSKGTEIVKEANLCEMCAFERKYD
jgi:hypothetical protein